MMLLHRSLVVLRKEDKMYEHHAPVVTRIVIALTTIVAAFAVAAWVATTNAGAAPPLTGAQKSCEHQVGGTFVVGDTEPVFGLPTIYQCHYGSAVDSSVPEVQAFISQCEHAYRGFPMTVPNDTPGGPGGFFCLVEAPPGQ
jgi:hypothetical protein